MKERFHSDLVIPTKSPSRSFPIASQAQISRYCDGSSEKTGQSQTWALLTAVPWGHRVEQCHLHCMTLLMEIQGKWNLLELHNPATLLLS